MKIVVLDGYSVSEEDMNWDVLQDLADVVDVYDRTEPDDVVERCRNAEIVLTNKVVLDAEVLTQLPRLQYIGVLATGYNVVDLEVASRQSIVVTNIPSYSTDSVVQMVFAHLLNIVSRVDDYARKNRDGKWSASNDFCYLDHPMFELSGKQFGVVGLGNIGMGVAKVAQALGMKVVAYTSKETLPDGMRKVGMDELFATSDIVSLHCPLVMPENATRTPATWHLVNEERLATMKPSAIIINTGRGPLVDEEAVATALHKGTIAAYATDVMTQEPPQADNPLLAAPNCYITPHIAWATREARQRLMNICINNIRAFLNDDPENQVNE